MDEIGHELGMPEMETSKIDPEISEFVTRMKAAWSMHPDLGSVSVPEARAIAEQVREPWRQGGPEMHHVADQHVELPSGSLRVRIYYPDDRDMLPALMYMHGGGFTLFSIDTHDRLMREYAAIGGFAAIAVDYPLSPEAKFPRALNLIVELTEWIAVNGQQWGINPGRLAIGGDSAGGNLALASALRLRDAEHADRLCAILSNYGAFGRRCSDEAEASFGGPNAVLNREEMEYYWANYLETPQDSDNPYACPLIADVSGLPPTLLVVAEIDILAEDSSILARRMEAAGTPCEVVIYRGATHSFLEAMSIAALAREAIAHTANWVKQRLEAE
jgi:acetyl esterase